jgi:probable O-glycosylation ligase (exosortase A-associated)
VVGKRARNQTNLGGRGALLLAVILLVVVIEYVGLALYAPWIKAIRLTTLLSYSVFLLALWQVGLGDLLRRPQSKALLALVIMSLLSMLWAVVGNRAFLASRTLIDYTLLMATVVMLVDRRTRIDAVSCTLALICAFLVITNADLLGSDIRAGVLRAGYFMGDGNDFAWGLVCTLPLSLSLATGRRSLVTRIAAIGVVGCCILGIIWSGSRGAALGLASSIAFYVLVISKRRFVSVTVVAVLAALVLAYSAPTYIQRLATTGNYQSDNSARGRLQAWDAAIQMAKDHSFGVGAGNFSSAYGRFYRPSSGQNALTWASERWISAHSIYFLVLGEYGFIGLAMLLYLLWSNFRDNARSRRALLAAGDAALLSPTLPALLNMSLVGFSVCGAFLGGVNYPHLFLLTALTISASRLASASARREPLLDVRRVRGGIKRVASH